MVWLQKTFYFQAFIAAFMFSGTLFKGDHNKRWDRARWVMHNIFWLLVLKERVFFSRRLTWSDNIDKKSFVIRGVVGYVSWIHLYRDEVNDISSSINHAKFSYQLPRIYSAPSSWLEIPKKKVFVSAVTFKEVSLDSFGMIWYAGCYFTTELCNSNKKKRCNMLLKWCR